MPYCPTCSKEVPSGASFCRSCGASLGVRVVDYDSRWPLLFEQEKTRILDVIAQVIVAVEHIGSTAVPGLGAKPTIDIMVGLRTLADAPECIPRLENIGYEYVEEDVAKRPQRRFFLKGPKGDRTHHLHMVETSSELWLSHLLFRDYLRSHPDVARSYFELKMQLAAKFSSDKAAYWKAKSSFMDDVLARARAEKAAAR